MRVSRDSIIGCYKKFISISFKVGAYCFAKVKRYISILDRSKTVRLRFVVYFTAFLFLILVLSVFARITIFTKSKNYEKTEQIEQKAEIYDRNGKLLVKNSFFYDFYLKPSEMIDVEADLNKITSIMPKIKHKYNIILSKLNEKKNTKDALVLVNFNISYDTKQELLKKGVLGLVFNEKKARHYIYGNLFSHTTGICDETGIGVSGLEKYIQNENLKDKLITSLDVNIQRVLYEELLDAVTNNNALGASGIVANINNGEILAAVNLPDFNPNDRSTFSNNTFNKYASGVYEFGSIFKLINTAMALENNIKFNKVYDISDDLEFGDYKIGEFMKKRKSVTMLEALMYSSNIASGKIALEAGSLTQQKFLYELGFMDRIKMEIPESSTPLVPSKKQWQDVATITISYGHGIAISHLQMMRAMVSILNNGRFTNLTFIKNIDVFGSEKGRYVVKSEVSKKMRYAMRSVTQMGAARKARSDFYDVGGKGGTAIKIDEKGKYSRKKNFLSFFAAFPMNDPKYAIILSVDEPEWSNQRRQNILGGSINGPLARRIIERIGFVQKVPTMSKKDYEDMEKFKTEIDQRRY